MNFKKQILVLILFSIGYSSFSQVAKMEKANLKYEKYNYIDARTIYLKVVENGYHSAEIYRKLGDTYYFNSEYTGGAKWYYDLINKFPSEATALDYFRAAQCLKSLDKIKEAERLLDIYKAMGGKAIAIDSYQNIADTLFSKGVKDKLFELEKVGINSEVSDFGPSFYGDFIVYSSNKIMTTAENDNSSKISGWDNQPFLNLFVAKVEENFKLSDAGPFSDNINSPYHESTPIFTNDLRTMYFTRSNYIDGKKGKDKDNVVKLKIYRATKIGDSWGNITELPFNDDSYSVGHPALSPEEDKLYFASDMPGTFGMSDIWYVHIIGDNIYSKPINMGNEINTVARELFPFISEENNLYFSSEGHKGLGGLDIFITPLIENSHGDIATFGTPINSTKDDFSFIIKEGRLGYFASNRDGNLGSTSDEIYQIWEQCEIEITGPIVDANTDELIPGATVSLIDENNNELQTITVSEDALFHFILDCDKNYIIRAKKEGYNPNEQLITTPKNPKTLEMPIKLNMTLNLIPVDPCPPNDLGCRLTLQPIYFDYDKADIRPDAEIELAKILAALNEYPQLRIHIESHTDSRGNDSYNMKLSEKRAQSTLKWLLNKGVANYRLSAKGYGESQLINQCINNIDCTEEEHQLNRRSMFLIED